jgi:hypothetical protein
VDTKQSLTEIQKQLNEGKRRYEQIQQQLNEGKQR